MHANYRACFSGRSSRCPCMQKHADKISSQGQQTMQAKPCRNGRPCMQIGSRPCMQSDAMQEWTCMQKHACRDHETKTCKQGRTCMQSHASRTAEPTTCKHKHADMKPRQRCHDMQAKACMQKAGRHACRSAAGRSSKAMHAGDMKAWACINGRAVFHGAC